MNRAYPTNDHLPQRPSWTCNQGCGDWPCEQAQHNLRVESAEHGLALGMYLVSCWITAVETDLRNHDARELYQRMIGWRHVDPVPVVTRRRSIHHHEGPVAALACAAAVGIGSCSGCFAG